MDFTIGFNLLKNEPPRSTYLGPGESDIHFVRIFYEWHFFEEDQGYYYYNLSRHIIDPDGTSDPIDGRPDVRVARFVNLRPDNLPYRLRKDPATGDWHLRVEGRIDNSLAPGSSHLLTVVARDDFQDQSIRSESNGDNHENDIGISGAGSFDHPESLVSGALQRQ